MNLLGCLLIGVFFCLIPSGPHLTPRMQTFLGVGLLGFFTTFSTLQMETLELLRTGDVRGALINLMLSLVLGLAAVVLGEAAARFVAP
ncbi:MAG: CrcB family protein [Planctomycetes bacterium]|nr:CrcB family protein [Planctomycetota bacterium]